MSRKTGAGSPIAPAARVFDNLQASEAILPAEPSPLRKASALTLALLMLCTVPVFWAAQAAGVIGDVPAAVAKGKSGAGEDDEGRERLGPAEDDADDRTYLRTDNTSGNNRSTRGTTRDRDTHTRTRGGTNDTSGNRWSTRGTTRDHDTKTRTKGGTNDTSRNGFSTRGTTRDRDTASNTLNSATGTGGGGTDTGGANGTDT